MERQQLLPGELRIFLNHIYELKKGVRNMVLYTLHKKYEAFAINRLESQNIEYVKQDVTDQKINLFFGKEECMNAVRFLANRPLNLLTSEEDFILGTLLGYDICQQCKRFCRKKTKVKLQNKRA